jgi:hypothetical protein
MADVQPLRALHYDLGRVGSLASVAAPPYDVIDAPQRAELAARSPYNAVHVDLPEGGPDPYAHAAELLEAWRRRRRARRRSRAGLVGASAGLHRTRRAGDDPPRLPRARARRGLRPRPHPPPRAHASGPEGGPAAPHARRRGRTSRRSSASSPTPRARPGAPSRPLPRTPRGGI